MNRRRSSATITSGGSRETGARALTVMPWGRPSAIVVMTVTPVTNSPMTSRNRAPSNSTTRSLREGLPPQPARPAASDLNSLRDGDLAAGDAFDNGRKCLEVRADGEPIQRQEADE